MAMKGKKRNSFSFNFISPDEIFLDSKNIPNFDSHQFEGRIEKPIGFRVFWFLTVLFLMAGIFLFGRIGQLQIVRGEYLSERAANNHLRLVPLTPERGLILDRSGEILAWNRPAFRLILGKDAFLNKDLRDSLNQFLSFLGKDDKSEIIERGSENGGKDLIVEIFSDWDEVNNVYQQWSSLPLRIESFSVRTYKDMKGIAHVVGYVGYPSLDDLEQHSFTTYEDVMGKDGVEKSYEDVLRGKYGFKLVEVDSGGSVKSESMQNSSVPGESVQLSIDSRIQEKMYEVLSLVSEERGFKGASGVILDISNGEILSLTNYPEYDSGVLSNGGPKELISGYINDSKKPFLNRAVSGVYAPGSVIKPFMAIAALNEKIITPEKQVFSSGSISVPNPYFPNKESIFYDWKAHGWVDMRRALAVSSNVYFYTIGGGYGDVRGLGISKINEYLQLFGFGKKTGIKLPSEIDGLVPDAEFKKQDSSDPVWRVGDTYNVSIGQGGLQVTPLQMAVGIAAVANGGSIVQPSLIRQRGGVARKLDIDQGYFQVAREGMRQSALIGTSQGLGSLPIEVASKTGTAELGSGKFVNSWLVAFWPFENPRFAMSIVLEKGSAENLIGGVFAARQLMEWMLIHTPEYLTN